MKNVKKEVTNVTSEENATVVASTIETTKVELQNAAKTLIQLKAELAAKMKELKEEAAKLKEAEKAKKAELKHEEASNRAKKMAEALANAGSELQVNKTERIRTFLLAGKTIDEIQEETGYGRKEILDRVWLIEKKLGIR